MIDFLVKTNGVKSSFSEPFITILQPVNERISVEFYQLWQNILLSDLSYSVEDLEQLHKATQEYLITTQNLLDEEKIWPETVIYLTLHLLSKKISDNDTFVWLNGLSGIPKGNIDPDKLVLEKINLLYSQWRKDDSHNKPSARFYAFFLLMVTALSDKNIERNVVHFADIKDYKMWIDKKNGIIENNFTDFVKKYNLHNGILGYLDSNSRDAIHHFLKVDTKDISLDKVNKTINILMVGLQGNGKTTFIKELYHAILKDYNIDNPLTQLDVVSMPEIIGGETEVILKPGKPSPTIAEYWELTGKFKIDKSSESYDLSFNDTRGEIIWSVPPNYKSSKNSLENLPSLEKKILTTDLLLIVIDPSLLFASTDERINRLFGNIISRLDYLFHYSKHAMFAIIFSKFDEYGVVLSGPRNLISTKNQGEKLLQYAQSATDSNWNSFISSVIEKYGTKESPLPILIKSILNKVKPFFTTICSRQNYPVINAYMVSIPKYSDSSKSFKRSGIPVIFEDFGNYYKFLTSIKKDEQIKPSEPLPPPRPKNIQVTPKPSEDEIKYLEVTWEMPTGFDGGFIIKRQLRHKNNGTIDNWKELASMVESYKYIDRDLVKNKYHKYQVFAVANNKTSESMEKPEIYFEGKGISPLFIIICVILALALIFACYMLLTAV